MEDYWLEISLLEWASTPKYLQPHLRSRRSTDEYISLSKYVLAMSDKEIILGKSKVWIQGHYSLSIVVPKVVAENLGIKAGDTVVFKLRNGMVIVEKGD